MQHPGPTMCLPHAVYITTPKPENHYPNSVVLEGMPSDLKPRKDCIYILNFTTTALDTFKAVFPLGLKMVIYIDNFDHFFYKFRAFKHLDFILLDDAPEPVDVHAAYSKVEDSIRKKLGTARNRAHKAPSTPKGFKTLEIIDEQRKEAARGVEISFFPRVFESIHSSLAYPERYMHTGDDVSAQIYRELLTGEKSLAELNACFKCKISAELKSLVFTSIVKTKDGIFYVETGAK